MAGLFVNRNRTAEDCVEIKYPLQVRITALLLTAFSMLCYAMILLGYMPLYGLTFLWYPPWCCFPSSCCVTSA